MTKSKGAIKIKRQFPKRAAFKLPLSQHEWFKQFIKATAAGTEVAVIYRAESGADQIVVGVAAGFFQKGPREQFITLTCGNRSQTIPRSQVRQFRANERLASETGL